MQPDTIRRRADLPERPAAFILSPAVALDAAARARVAERPHIAGLFEAAAHAWQSALYTLGEDRDRLNRAGEAAWCAAAAQNLGAAP